MLERKKNYAKNTKTKTQINRRKKYKIKKECIQDQEKKDWKLMTEVPLKEKRKI